jgi:hypothetical protein
MNFTDLNESNIHSVIDGILSNVPILDFKSRIKKFANVLMFMHEKQISLNSIKINTNINTKIKESDIFFEILNNKNIQKFIFDNGFDDDLKEAESYDDLKTIYSHGLEFIEMSATAEEQYSDVNSYVSFGMNCGAFENAISLGMSSSMCIRAMSRCNDYGGLKSVDYPFNPF